MSRVVITPIHFEETSGRTATESLRMRFPRTAARATNVFSRIPPGRIKARLFKHLVVAGYSSLNRFDFDALFSLYAPDCVIDVGPELTPIGFDSLMVGPQHFIDQATAIQDVWALSYAPTQLIDLGLRFIVVVRMKGTGRGSGLVLEREVANLYEFRRGLVAEQKGFSSIEDALAAASVGAAAPAR